MSGLTREYLIEQYVKSKRSFADISSEFGTYPNKILREAIRFGIKPRDKSNAQKNALKSGRHKHPTKGTQRSKETKIKISNKVSESWQNISDKEYNRRIKQSQKRWEKMSKADKDALMKAAGEGVRKAGKEGSKMEKFLLEGLTKSGREVIFHKMGLIANQNLEIDLFLPDSKVAIEVDGPSHFFPIWGEENLQKVIKSDAQKSGLLLQSGLVVLRIKHITKNFSAKRRRDLLAKVINVLEQVEKKFPEKSNRFLEIDA